MVWSASCADEFPECLAGVGRSPPLPYGGGGGPDVSGLICYNIASVLPFGVLASWHVGSSLFNQ